MIKRLITLGALTAALVQGIPCAGQNLVPNPSFEQYNACPNGISSLMYDPGYTSFPTAKYWGNALQQGSADYFNACAPKNTYVSVPWNGFGYQTPRSGNAYAGIIAWQGS